MRSAPLFVLLAACGFEHGAAGRVSDGAVEGDDAPPGEIDAQMIDARMIDAPPMIAPYCDSTDTAIVACYQFESTANDASPHMLNATTANVTFPTGKVGKAMLFGATSAAEVADSTALNVAALTIEAWINPSQLPGAGLRMGITDMDGQAGFFLQEGGQIRCIANTSLQVAANIAINTWTHVACTYDPPNLTIYVNGVAFTPATNGGALSTTSTSGLSIAADNPAGSGSRLIGMIDELRIMSRARTAKEICLDAGACTP